MEPHRSIPVRLASILLPAVAVLAACGGGNETPSAASPSADEPSAAAAVCSELPEIVTAPLTPEGVTALDDATEQAAGAVGDALRALVDGLRASDVAASRAAAQDAEGACADEGVAVTGLAAQVEGSFHLAGASTTPTYTCTGADATSQTLLDVLAEGAVNFEPTLTVDPVAPVPAQGDAFTARFSGSLAVDPDIVASVIEAGITTASLSEVTIRVLPGVGVEGEELVAEVPPATFTLEPDQPVGLDVGPFEQQFTRTDAAGQPVSFEAGPMTITIGAALAGAPIELRLSCEPGGATSATLTEALAHG